MVLRKYKQAKIDNIKWLTVIIFSSIVLVVSLVTFMQIPGIQIDSKNTDNQIIIKNVLSKCFSQEHYVLNEKEITQETLENCFSETNDQIFLRLNVDDGKNLYFPNKEDFTRKAQFCSNQNNNLNCKQLIFPISLKNDEEYVKLAKLTIQSITS